MEQTKATRTLSESKLHKWIYVLVFLQVSTHIVLPGLLPLQNRFFSFPMPGNAENKIVPVESDVMTLCCPGGGFAGFWFTLGRLSSMEGRGSIEILGSSEGRKGVPEERRNHTFLGEEGIREFSGTDLSESHNSKW